MDAKKCYQFPGVFTKTCTQQLYYIVDSSKLCQTCDDVHFMCHWKDIQLSKGQLNKKRLISADVAGKKIYYSSAPCLRVKVRPHKGCDYVVPIREHNLPLQRTSGCPVEFVYVHPKDPNDKRRVTVLSKGSI